MVTVIIVVIVAVLAGIVWACEHWLHSVRNGLGREHTEQDVKRRSFIRAVLSSRKRY